jgi:pimeloyl-ACP methyl ester carboxylesterase
MAAVWQQLEKKSQFREYPVDVDPRTGLFGILTKPAHCTRKVGFIIINSGLLHRVGPFRLYVDIARNLAAEGYPSIRLDQPGKGDSDATPGVALADATVASIIATAQSLTAETGVEQFVVGGLCSGADDVLEVAGKLSGLCGLVLFDGYAPRTARYYVNRYSPKVLSLQSWLKHLGLGAERPSVSGKTTSLRNWSARSEMIARYRTALDSEIRILAVFTSGAGRFYNYVSQLTVTLGHPQGSRLISEHYVPEATHLFPVSAHRREVIERVVRWACDEFA